MPAPGRRFSPGRPGASGSWNGIRTPSTCPEGAELLVTGERCRNQAFRIGHHVYAFQFHFEATRPMLRSWVKAANPAALAKTHPDFLPDSRSALARHMPAQAVLARQISDGWLDLVEASAAPRRLQKAG